MDGPTTESSESLRERAVAHAFAHARACEARMLAAEARAAELESALNAVHASAIWRLAQPAHRLARRHPGVVARLRRLAGGATPADPPPPGAGAAGAAGAAVAPPPTLDAVALPVDCAAEPLVSILISSYGRVQTTLDCLASIAAAWPEAPVEVIVVDDASGDPGLSRLAAVPGLRLIDTGENAGYLAACNMGAAQARGAFLLLLNNDTLVMPGWLDPMLDLMRDDPGAGAVGSKLLYPDGRLQEAGCVVWRDGSGLNVGRGEEPAAPEAGYVREVDYCSAACLLVRRDVFLELGGFDARYAPAYCEDSDLAFRLRAKGLRVLYQPRSEVVHIEGGSHGTDEAAGGKAFQARNQAILARTWRTVLDAEHFPPGRHVLRARDRAAGRRVVLLADHHVPEPDRDAGSNAVVAMLRALADSVCVVKFLPLDGRADRRLLDPWRDAGVEVLAPLSGGRFDAWAARYGEDVDNVVLMRPNVAAPALGVVRLRTAAAVAYYTHDLHFARMRRQADMQDDPAMAEEARKMEVLERRIFRAADVVLSPSEDETREVRALEPGVDCRTIAPYAFDRFAEARPPAPGGRLLFVAGFAHPPNEDAAVWLVRDILPRVLARAPGARLRIVGSRPTPAVRALAGERVDVVPDVSAEALDAEYAAARVAVVPLRFGAGVKLKAVEAMRHGVPLVTTPTGAQGLPGLAEAAHVADSADAFAAAVCALLADDAAWSSAAARQTDYVRARFSREAHRRLFLAALSIDPDRPEPARAGRR